MATVYYDRYGGFQGTNPAPPLEKLPYMVKDVGGGVKYICYTPDDANGKRVIERVTEESSEGTTLTTIEHGYGEWDNPGDTTFYPINEAIPVEVEG